MNPKYHAKLVPNNYYHIFNRTNSNGEKLFFKPENYLYFLKKWGEYLNDHTSTLAYCLIPNHYHFLIRIKDNTSRDNTPSRGVIPKPPKAPTVEEALRRFSITYTQAINKQQQRRGSLFQEHPKRLAIESDEHVRRVIYYIHQNPIHHGLVSDIEQWRYSSYHALNKQKKTQLESQQVLNLFGHLVQFQHWHQQQIDPEEIEYCITEG